MSELGFKTQGRYVDGYGRTLATYAIRSDGDKQKCQSHNEQEGVATQC